MAFTTLPTYSTGDSVTAANWNTHIKDNFAAMPPDIFTATGEIFVGEGADTGGLLSPSDNYTPLIVDAGETLGVRWSDTYSDPFFTFAHYNHDDYIWDTYGGTSVSISVHDATGFNVPAGAVMLLTTLRVGWDGGSTDDYVILGNASDTDMEMLRIDYSAHYGTNPITQSGFVAVSGGDITLEISDSSDVRIRLYFTGYITT